MSTPDDRHPPSRRHPWLFFALVLGWSWLLWIPIVLSGQSQLAFPGILLYVLGGLGPPLAAVFLLYRVQPLEDRRDYWRRVVDARRISPIWYAVICLLPLALNVLGILTGILLGAPAPSFERAGELLASPLSIVSFYLVVLLFGPLPEELGWRGYALDELQERQSALTARRRRRLLGV
jgi:membrane protease YdiL (CAAX protease family)